MTSPPVDFRPAASLHTLRQRGNLLRKLRAFFEARNFLEVETPMLSVDSVIDRHLDPLQVLLYPNPQQPFVGSAYYLQTSPEFAMKRLLAAGAEAIFQVTHAFRAAERGPLHNPEFTMVEWYRTGDDLTTGMQLLSDLAEQLFLRGAAERLTYREAFQRYAAIDPLTATGAELAAAATAHGLTVPDSFSTSDPDLWLELLLSEVVQPQLGQTQPTIVYHFPASQAALATVLNDDPPVAERFELFVSGVELANGYHELRDAEELRRRNQANNRLRLADGKPPLPIESRLLAAMQSGLPPCSGTALGFDRAVMVALGETTIDSVMAFPLERA